MNFSHTFQDDVLIITPEIENLDTKNATDFKQQVIELISNYENPKVVFDLHRLQFVDSSGLGSFLSILKALNKQGGNLKLSCLNRSTRATLEVVSLHKIFEIFKQKEEAISSFK
ncbi:STAS domain-containing protein [Parachlamydia sp. AcF125]|uniref:STAS domain-containing protein n=1 Tax=Parachlamydia sp. AcF125 TaxID=2795736 RepID=UPI001BD8931E|nr:STAS domain-containing protein [Parachlamydia sp. AcF125]MBS4167531.1 putative anti-sigma factor antagonist [Parachlamydia sp. AcF125]